MESRTKIQEEEEAEFEEDQNEGNIPDFSLLFFVKIFELLICL